MSLPDLKEIRNKRRALNLTQKDLAELTKLNRSTISKIETKNLDPSYKTVKRIFEELEKYQRQTTAPERIKNLTLKDVHNTPVKTVDASQLIHEVTYLMAETNFSQFPVKSKGVFIGSITERTITKAIYENKFKNLSETPTEKIMEEPFPTLSENTPLSLAGPLIMRTQAVLTQRNGEIIGIVTDSDIGKTLKKT